MTEDRLEVAVEAAAKAMHEFCREKHQSKWETCSEYWQQEMRDYLRPSIKAALEAIDMLSAKAGPGPAPNPPEEAEP
jgi:hypothetical protein